jgi:LPXTG-motif cell wall-anchored protein
VQNDNYGKRLEGAEFTLYQEGEDEPLKTYITDSEGTFTIVQSKDSAEFQFESDTLYYVTETTAPEGYQLPDDPDKYYFYFSDKEMESLPEGVMSAVNLRESSDRVFVENAQSKEPDEEPVYELVDTGGRGTRMFYIIGGILMLGSGILLITKKRAGSK